MYILEFFNKEDFSLFHKIFLTMQSKIPIWGWYQAQSTHFGLKGIKFLYSFNISIYIPIHWGY